MSLLLAAMGAAILNYVEFISFNVLELNCNRALSRLRVVDVAGSVRSEVRMPILKAWDLIFPVQRSQRLSST